MLQIVKRQSFMEWHFENQLNIAEFMPPSTFCPRQISGFGTRISIVTFSSLLSYQNGEKMRNFSLNINSNTRNNNYDETCREDPMGDEVKTLCLGHFFRVSIEWLVIRFTLKTYYHQAHHLVLCTQLELKPCFFKLQWPDTIPYFEHQQLSIHPLLEAATGLLSVQISTTHPVDFSSQRDAF